MKELLEYTEKEGNKYFELRLKDFTDLGDPYQEYWKNAKIDYQVTGWTNGTSHCKDVENNIWELIKTKIKFFPDKLLYLFSISAALHDCQKGVPNHGVAGANKIRSSLVDLDYVKSQATANAIAEIVKVHELGNFDSIVDDYIDLGGCSIRIEDAAAIFRLADMMSTSDERTLRLHKILGNPRDKYNSFLEDVRGCIRSCRVGQKDRTVIEIRAEVDTSKLKCIEIKKNIENYVKGLNRDLTERHIQLLTNNEFYQHTPEKDNFIPSKIDLPSSFKLIWRGDLPLETSDANENSTTVVPKNLVQCYFLNKETDLDIYNEFMQSLESGKVINPKFLYWTLRGTKEYLSLCKDSTYILANNAHNLLAEVFKNNFYPIINEHNSLLQIIDLGVGDGREFNIIINCLLSDEVNISKVCCSLVDSSYHMLRVAVYAIVKQNISNKYYKKKIELCAINSDIQDINLYKDIIKEDKGSRLFCFLGGTIGNYVESEMLNPINNEMSKHDYLLLGADLIGGRSDKEIESAYTSDIDKKFIFNPLADIGLDYDQCEFKFEVKTNVSEAKNAKTVIARCLLNNLDVQMGKSTKYDLQGLTDYLVEKANFQIIEAIVSNDQTYLLILLQKKH